MEADMNPIDQVFSGVIRNSEVSPPADSWYIIERELNRKKQIRAIVIIRTAAASVALALAFAGGYYVADHHRSEIPVQSAVFNGTQVNTQQTPGKNLEHTGLQPAVTHSDASIQLTSNSGKHELKEIVSPVSKETTVRYEKPLNRANAISFNSSREESPVLIKPLTAVLSPSDKAPLQTLVQNLNDMKLAKPVEDENVLYADLSDDKNASAVSHWSLGGQASPLYAFRSTDATSSRSVANITGTSSSMNESGIVSYGGGLNVQYKASRRLSVSTGLYYSRMGQLVHGNELIASGTVATNYAVTVGAATSMTQNGSAGFIERRNSSAADKFASISSTYKGLVEANPSTQVVNLRQNMDFLEIPLMVRYRIVDRKIGLHLLGGLSTNILAGNTVLIDGESGYTSYGRTNGLSTWNYTSIMGLGLDYGLSANLKASIEPAFRYYLNSINTSNTADTHPYSFGIYTGIAYSF